MTPMSAFRPGEEIDARVLADYLRGKLEGVESGLRIEQFPGGHSNLTYLLHAGGREYVLRRPPLGPVAPKAHDMAREYSVLRAVHPVFQPAPQVFLLCEDPAVIGAIFFIMERRHGVVLRRDVPADYGAAPDFGRRVSQGFVDCLAALHKVDVDRIFLGKPAGFLERQVRGWADRWERAKTEEIPEMTSLIRWLVDRLPVSGPPTLVHNDYKLDNLMLDASDPGPRGSCARLGDDHGGRSAGGPRLHALLLGAGGRSARGAATPSARSPRSPDGTRARRWWTNTRARPAATSAWRRTMKCSDFSKWRWYCSRSIFATSGGRRRMSASRISTCACAG